MCKVIGIATFAVGTAIGIQSISTKTVKLQDASFFIAAGAGLCALGNNATSNKKTTELTALLARATNSASQLPDTLAESSKRKDESTRDYLRRI